MRDVSEADDTAADARNAPADPITTARLLRRRLESAPLELPVTGQSMGETIRSGSTVRLTEPSEPRKGEVWAFVGTDSTIVVHRVRRLTEESMTGRGDGNRRDDRTVPRTHLIGRVRSSIGPDGERRRFGTFDRLRAALLLRARDMARKSLSRVARPRRAR